MSARLAAWRTPLAVLIAATLISAVCIGLRNTFGLYLRPMTETLGWGRETFAIAIALQNLTWGLTAPLTGGLADRYGSGRVLVGGGLCYAAGLLMMSQVATPTALFLSTGLLIGLGTSATGFGVVMGAIGRSTSEARRSLYMGIASAGGSFGQFLLVPLSQGAIGWMGWAEALVMVSVLSLVMVPLAALVTGRAEPGTGTGADSSPSRAFRAAGKEGRFWLLFWGFFVCGFHITFIATHLPAYLTDNGISPTVAAWALSTIGLFNIIGSLSFGYLGGKYSKRRLLCGLYLARAIFIGLFIALPLHPASVLLFAAGMGSLWLATVPLTSGLVAQMYGVRYMSTLFGGVFLGHQLGAFLGVWAGGRVYDLTGSYTPVWLVAMALGVISSLLHWPIDERSREERLAAASLAVEAA